MTGSRDRFEKFIAEDTSGLSDTDKMLAWHVWQEAERQTIERCALMCESSSGKFHDSTWKNALSCAANAVRSMRASEDKESE